MTRVVAPAGWRPAAFAGAAALILTPVDRWLDAPAETLVWIHAATLFALAVLVFSFGRRQGGNPWLSPAFLVLFIYAVLFGWGGVVVYYWGFVPWRVHPELRDTFYVQGVWHNLPAACRLSLIGGLGLFIGVTSPAWRFAGRLPLLGHSVDLGKLKRAIVVVVPALKIADWLLYPNLPLAFQFIETVFVSVTDSLLVLASYFCFRAESRMERIRWLVFLVASYAVSLPGAMRSGQLVPMFMPGLMILFGYVIARGRPPWGWLALGAPAAVFVLLPFTTLYKYSPEAEQPADRLWVAAMKFRATDLQERVEIALSRTVARFAVIHFPAVYTQFYPRVYPYEYGETFRLELVRFMPRVLWSDKPDVAQELNRYSASVGVIRSEDSGVSMVFDAISEYYLNFGVVGVFLLSILHGWYHVLLYEWLAARHVLAGTAIFLSLVANNWDFFGVVNIFEPHVKFLAVWLIMYYFFARRTRWA